MYTLIKTHLANPYLIRSYSNLIKKLMFYPLNYGAKGLQK